MNNIKDVQNTVNNGKDYSLVTKESFNKIIESIRETIGNIIVINDDMKYLNNYID